MQNHDKRVIFINPYEDDLALIGTTDIPYEGRPEDVAAEASEIDYLLKVGQPLLQGQAPPTGRGPQLLRRAAAVRRQRRQPDRGDARLRLRPRRDRRRARCSTSSAARSPPSASSPSMRWTSCGRSSRRWRRLDGERASARRRNPNADFEQLLGELQAAYPWMPRDC